MRESVSEAGNAASVALTWAGAKSFGLIAASRPKVLAKVGVRSDGQEAVRVTIGPVGIVT